MKEQSQKTDKKDCQFNCGNNEKVDQTQRTLQNNEKTQTNCCEKENPQADCCCAEQKNGSCLQQSQGCAKDDSRQVFQDKAIALLNGEGFLTCPSYCLSNMYEYRPDDIACSSLSKKEWEFYQISDGTYCVQVTYGHTSYMASVGCTFIDFATSSRISLSKLIPFGAKKYALPFSTDTDHKLHYSDRKMDLTIVKVEGERRIKFASDKINLDLHLCDGGDAMCYCMQFAKKLFYFNIKKVFPSLSGHICADGKQLAIDNAYAVLDSGRGCWPYRHSWFWGMGRGFDGNVRIDFDIGYGSADRSKTTENMVFINGKGHKLGVLKIIPNFQNYMDEWKICDSTGQFCGKMLPDFDNFTQTNFLVVHNRCHQVFGKMYATINVDGKTYTLDGAPCFIEHAVNRW